MKVGVICWMVLWELVGRIRLCGWFQSCIAPRIQQRKSVLLKRFTHLFCSLDFIITIVCGEHGRQCKVLVAQQEVREIDAI